MLGVIVSSYKHLGILLVWLDPWHIIVSPDESRGYYAFVIVMPPPQRFLVCPLQPTVLVQSFSNSGHMSHVFNRFSSYSHQICVAPRSRRQSIFASCSSIFGHCKLQSFQLIFFKFTTNIPQTKAYMPSNFQCSAVPFLATRGPSSFFLYVPYNP